MKRILLMIGVLIVGCQLSARDIHITSWVELTEMVLAPTDCIIKGDVQNEQFVAPKEVSPEEKIDTTRTGRQESNAEQYPKSQIIRMSSDQVITNRQIGTDYWEQAAQWDKAASKDQPKKYELFDQHRAREDRQSYSTGATNTNNTHEIQSGTRFYIEEDSWWHTKDRTRQSRRLVLVPAAQKSALWRTVTVIKPKIFWNGHKYAGQFFTYGATEEYRFSSSLKIAALLGFLSAGLIAYTQSI